MTALAASVVEHATALGRTVAIAESLTGGAVAAEIVAVPGASAVLRLGVVAYATPMKASVLGVDVTLLAERGAVDGDVAAQMAEGVRMLATIDGVPADIGVATTGVAGPDPQDGHAPGEVHVGVATAAGAASLRIDVVGDRDTVRATAVEVALERVLEILRRSTGAAEDGQE